MQIDVSRDGETLSLQASLVYGDPPCARLEGDRLVHLRGAMPVRDIVPPSTCGKVS